MKIIDYRIITGNSENDELDKRCQDKIKDGWQPLGSPSFIESPVFGGVGKSVKGFQAMVRYEEPAVGIPESVYPKPPQN